MIIISKKKILVVSSLLFLFLFTIGALINNETNKNNKYNINTIETVALPVSNKVIVIDAGHGKPDEGAQSSNRNNRSRT